MADDFDPLVLGARIRDARRRRDATLADVGALVGRPAPYLSQLENGKVEPKLGFLTELAEALGTTTADLLDPTPPDRRAELEIGVARAQEDPRYVSLGLPYLKPSAKVADDVLEHILALWRLVVASTDDAPVAADHRRFADHARAANIALREEMRSRDNYFAEIEDVANTTLRRAGYGGSGPISERVLT